MTQPLLVAFDFDHTIVNGNTDVIVQTLVSKEKITPDVRKLHSSDGWTAFMQAIFYLLYENGVTPMQIRDTIVSLPVTPGMDKLLRSLDEWKAEVIIISDSNSVFIQDWLSDRCLSSIVKKVFTNPASYDGKGCLKIEMYHLQDWCQLSTKNMCKGHILRTYIEERASQGVTFSQVAYVGDGKNDLCPCLYLSENDLAFVREGFALEKCIREMQEKEGKLLKADVHIWNSGDDIIEIISDRMVSTKKK